MIVKQFVYYKDFSSLNNPYGLLGNKLLENFTIDEIYDEIQVKAFPGAKLFINGQEIIIGDVGVYNIPVKEYVKITSVKTDAATIRYIQDNEFASLIVTFLKRED